MFGDAQLSSGVIAALGAATVSTAGLLTMAGLGDWGRRNSPYFSAFAIGFLLVAVLFHLVPEAMSFSFGAWRWVIGGFAGMTAIGLGLRLFTRRRVKGENLAFGYASIFALGTHSFLDGIVYDLAYHDEVFTGLLATAGLLLHEFPEGVIAFFLLREAGMRPRAAGLWAFVAASLTTVAGASIAAYSLLSTPLPYAAFLGVAAGSLIYIMALHLGPHAKLTPKGRGYLMAGLGVVVGLAAIIFKHTAGAH